MTPVRSAGEVLEAIQKVKAGATAFCTNFFPVQSKLENWVAHQELSFESSDDVIFFLRKDRDFAHLYFCASNPAAFGDQLRRFSSIPTQKLAIDLVGAEASVGALLKLTEEAGFARYSRLVRLARAAAPASPPKPPTAVEVATEGDASAILALIEQLFDRFADQLPLSYEIAAAVAARQIFVVKENGRIAALLFFETQGLTSTIRYWLVAPHFHSCGFGSALIRHYFSSQTTVRRFLLWVAATNDNAIQKYQHYGYAPDGLVDYVLVNGSAKN